MGCTLSLCCFLEHVRVCVWTGSVRAGRGFVVPGEDYGKSLQERAAPLFEEVNAVLVVAAAAAAAAAHWMLLSRPPMLYCCCCFGAEQFPTSAGTASRKEAYFYYMN